MPSFAPASHVAHASRSVVELAAFNVRLCTATTESCRHAFAAASVGKLRRIFLRSRLHQTQLSQLGSQLQAPPSRERQPRPCLARVPVVLLIAPPPSVVVVAPTAGRPALRPPNAAGRRRARCRRPWRGDRKSTRLNSSHTVIS